MPTPMGLMAQTPGRQQTQVAAQMALALMQSAEAELQRLRAALDVLETRLVRSRASALHALAALLRGSTTAAKALAAASGAASVLEFLAEAQEAILLARGCSEATVLPLGSPRRSGPRGPRRRSAL